MRSSPFPPAGTKNWGMAKEMKALLGLKTWEAVLVKANDQRQGTQVRQSTVRHALHRHCDATLKQKGSVEALFPVLVAQFLAGEGEYVEKWCNQKGKIYNTADTYAI